MAKNKYITITAKVIAPKKHKYDMVQLRKGMRVEAEHTPDKKLQEHITKNHLDEDPNYYKKLLKMEKKK